MSQSTLLPGNRVVMISGSNRGMGKAITKRLYWDGFRLSVGARCLETLHPLTRDMDPKRYIAHQYEATAADAASAWVSATALRFERIDGLVNNAGVVRRFTLEDDEEDALEQMWQVDVKEPLRLTRAAYPYLKKAGSGRVVNIVSLFG